MLMKASQFLEEIRSRGIESSCKGLSDERIQAFLASDPLLPQALERAANRLKELEAEEPELLKGSEGEIACKLQAGILNFYPADCVSPYVPLTALGPWIVTLAGAVIYDTGGYGMLGFGHNPEFLLKAMSKEQVMANVMTPSFSQGRMIRKLKNSIGFTHKNGCPFEQFICMNSGSEAMEVARRIMDVRVRELTDPGAIHHGKKVMSLTLEKSFHGRTTMAARVSHSSRKGYMVLSEFRDLDNLIVVEPNDIAGLEAAFKNAADNNIFIEGVYMEPVMGEGNPGIGLTREFYDRVRALSNEHGALFAIDSVQASLRAHGVLSIVDYPGFEDCEAPDAEAYSKALNGGQYPLSVLAMRGHVAEYYRKGLYGNTMTTNPRALDVACEVMDAADENFRKELEAVGKEFLAKLGELQKRFPDSIGQVQGTGLLLSAEVTDRKVVGPGALEEVLRKRGVNVIHGGENSLRFTPWLKMNSAEVDLICDVIAETLTEMPAN